MAAPEITCVGEVLVDFISMAPGTTLALAPGFRKCAGGAGAHVAAGRSKLGVRTAFVGKTGDDPFGQFLRSELDKCGVLTTGLVADPHYRTRLAFVSVTRAGDRDFEFWEARPADEQLRLKEIPYRLLASSRLVHVGSFLLHHEPSRSAVLGVARRLWKEGKLVSFDPNIRLSLWKSRTELRKVMLEMVRYAAILRLNAEEAHLLTGETGYRAAARRLMELGPSLVAVTLGHRGSYAATFKGEAFVPAFRVKSVDTTGCGDGFLAGLLSGTVRAGRAAGELDGRVLSEICYRANAVGALTSTRPGVIGALPTARELKRFLASQCKTS